MKNVYNPFLPSWEYIPDGEPRVFGDRLYLFGSHDRFGGGAYCLNDYVCWSAPVEDLSDWRYEGVIYPKTADPANPAGEMELYAPDVIQGPDGRYYLYYALNNFSAMSVAVCDEPAGQYRFLGYVRKRDGQIWGHTKGDVFPFDPGVFMDSDGRVYLYAGFAPRLEWIANWEIRERILDGAYCVELAPDMLTIKTPPVLVCPGPECCAGTGFEEHAFFEASSLRKIGDTYYFVYSSVNNHELCCALGNRPEGPFTYSGVLVSIGDVGLNPDDPQKAVNYLGNTHGGLAEVNGQWYVFYHRHTNQSAFSRQACAERITIGADGRIPQAEITSCGLNNGPLTAEGTFEARIACHLQSREGAGFLKPEQDFHPYFTQSGGDRESGGDQYIANMTDGAMAGYKVFRFDGTVKTIAVTGRGPAEGYLHISTEDEEIARIPISPSEDWTEIAADMVETQGVHPLFFTFRGTGAFDLLSFCFR